VNDTTFSLFWDSKNCLDFQLIVLVVFIFSQGKTLLPIKTNIHCRSFQVFHCKKKKQDISIELSKYKNKFKSSQVE
jgi:hypothetical protein